MNRNTSPEKSDQRRGLNLGNVRLGVGLDLLSMVGSQCPCKMPFLAVCACNPTAGEVEVGGACWAGNLAEAVNPRSTETLIKKKITEKS